MENGRRSGTNLRQLGVGIGTQSHDRVPGPHVDLAIARNIRLAPRQLQSCAGRVHLFDTSMITGRQNQAEFNSPTDLTLRNPEFVVNASDTTLALGATGTISGAAATCPNVGFGVANAWSTTLTSVTPGHRGRDPRAVQSFT